MKKLFLYIFLVLIWCNVGFAEDKVLECLLWDHYYDENTKKWGNHPEGENKWKLKIDDTNMYVYDYTYESYHPNPYPIVLEKEENIIAVQILYDSFMTTINYNKKTGHTIVMSSDVVMTGNGASIGNCK